jgi:predicted molibdopterin-dependent oxidoreductase YjgC
MLRRAAAADLTIRFAGKPVPARPGDSVAAALLAAGIVATGDKPRGPYCMMGACFACVVSVGGRTERACMTEVHDGMSIEPA